MSSVQPRREMGTGLIVVLSIVGALVLVAALLGVAYLAAGPPRPMATGGPTSSQIAAVCSGLDSQPDDPYAVATRVLPPVAVSGQPLAGTGRSYRQAAQIINDWCPQYYGQGQLLRQSARIYDPSGG